MAQSSASGIPATNGVAQPSTCDTDTLGSATGPVQLRADFTPEEIDLRWYNNNTLLNVTSTSSNTCTYDTAISLPTNPTKTGYKFKGWKIRPQYDFTTLPGNQTALSGYGKSAVGHCVGIWNTGTETESEEGNEAICAKNEYSDLGDNEWVANFSWGTLYGISLCSSSASSRGENGTPDQNTSGAHCWCLATGYVPNGENIKYGPSKTMFWTYESECIASNGGNMCSSVCAGRCGAYEVFYRILVRGLLNKNVQ